MTKRKCIICRKAIRESNEKAEHLFNRPNDEEVWVCGPKCLRKYNEED